MQTRDFHYKLPEALIAQYPPKERSASRMMVLDRQSGSLTDSSFSQLPDFLLPGDCLVFNDTRVIPARMYGQKTSGGMLEVFIERIINPRQALAQIRCSKSPKPGSHLRIFSRNNAGMKSEAQHELRVVDRSGVFFVLESASDDLMAVMTQCGHMPLPPYIQRADEPGDTERYQTVYSSRPGAVAAPTAGLHFDDAMIKRLKQKGIETAYVTLHVGAGTFQPVRCENITEHKMHAEYIEVSAEAVERCNTARANGGRIIAIGTTSVRCLETASLNGRLEAYSGDTRIFIYPGYRFFSVDAMLTNFHLPESTLLMLVSAFASREIVLEAYRHAIEQRYRFFSYGDAMLLI